MKIPQVNYGSVKHGSAQCHSFTLIIICNKRIYLVNCRSRIAFSERSECQARSYAEIQGRRLIDNSFDFNKKEEEERRLRVCMVGVGEAVPDQHRANSLNTGWVKVPVKFPALAVVAQLRIKMEWNLRDSNPSTVTLYHR